MLEEKSQRLIEKLGVEQIICKYLYLTETEQRNVLLRVGDSFTEPLKEYLQFVEVKD